MLQIQTKQVKSIYNSLFVSGNHLHLPGVWHTNYELTGDDTRFPGGFSCCSGKFSHLAGAPPWSEPRAAGALAAGGISFVNVILPIQLMLI